MKYLFSIWLLICLVFQNLVVVVGLQIQTMMVKWEMEEKIEKSENYDDIFLTIDELHQYQVNQKELNINGIYFDFKRIEISDGCAHIFGFWDYKETKLKGKLFAQADQSLGDKTLHLFPHILNPFIIPAMEKWVYYEENIPKNDIHFPIFIKLNGILFKILKPPMN